MRRLRVFLLRLGDRFLRREREQSLSAEIEAHLAMHIDDNVRAGMTPAEARRRALVALGGVEATKEAYRDRRGLPFVETLLQDVRLGWRGLVRNPGFSFVAITALAVGIGANVAIFSLANAVLIRPLPVSEPDRIVRVATFNFSATPYEEFEEYRKSNRTLESLMAFNGTSLGFRVEDAPEHVFGMAVSGNYFEGLRVAVAMGRPITPTDDDRHAPGVALLSDRFWRRRFGADRSVLGRPVIINGQPYTIVGVVPPQFTGTMTPIVPDVWVPWNGPAIGPADVRRAPSVHLIGRLADGATIPQVQADLNALASGIAARSPSRQNLRVTVYPGRTLYAEISQPVTAFVGLLASIVGLVLLIACVNIANLLLARSAARRQEIGVRLALGAGRWRLVRQLVTESAVLAAVGTAAGVVLALVLMRVGSAFELPAPVPVALDLTFDWRSAAFTVAMTAVTTLLFGLAPAWRGVNVALTQAIKSGSAGSGRIRSRLRSSLMAVQVALSTLLLVTGAVLLRGMTVARALDRGFDGAGVLTASVDLDAGGYTADRGRLFLEDLVERLAEAPGVTAAHATPIVPLTLSNNQMRFDKEGDDERAPERPWVYFNQVTPGHFATLGIPLLAGRDFTRADRAGSTSVGIVNETLAGEFWPGESPIGKRLRPRGDQPHGGPWIEVVGLARNSKYITIGESPAPFLYRPLVQEYEPAVTLLVRTTGDPMSALPVMRAVVRGADPELPLFNISPLDAITAVSLLPIQVAAIVAGTLGLVALALAAIGLYGVMSYLVRQRTSEIGMRIALGATPRQVIRAIAWQGMRWTAAGLAMGLVASFMLTRLLTSLLYGVHATDAVAFAGITVLLTATAYAACYLPARRASRLDPLVALRYE